MNSTVFDSAPGTTSARAPFVRLSIMMFLEFVVFGSWFATLGLVLAANKMPAIIGTAYSLAAVAAIVSPLFLGALGDRFFQSQRLLSFVHIAGGLVMLCIPGAVAADNGQLVLLLILAYMILFMPTLALTNSIALAHLPGSEHLFPFIRVFGTVGWVVAGLLVGWLGFSASTHVFTVAAVASFVLGVFSLGLPSTPPPAKGAKFSVGDVIGAKALVLFKNRNFSVLMVCALLTSISLGVYNTFASPYLSAIGIQNVAGVLAIGQASEVVFIVTIPFVVARFGIKRAILLGMVMWGARFGLFIMAQDGQSWFAIAAVALQGICNDFFLILSAMFIDRQTPPQLKAQAQSWLILVVSGFGSGIGSFVAGEIFGAKVAPNLAVGAEAWTPLWLFPIGCAVVTAIIWTLFFKPIPIPRDDA
ncbi:MFS transporter [Rhizobium sp. X9]|uniref:MFS transporter n=1 Tax=Rhizobium sp. X9 TaxID=2815360 RepID=UPI001C0E0B17|nr:MFS transporter [Rhizobium sp. X9]